MDTLIVSSKEFRTNFPKYQELVEQGVSITIVKRSKPIFVLQPVDLAFEGKITDSLIDYEKHSDKEFVDYDDVFPQSA